MITVLYAVFESRSCIKLKKQPVKMTFYLVVLFIRK